MDGKYVRTWFVYLFTIVFQVCDAVANTRDDFIIFLFIFNNLFPLKKIITEKGEN